MLVHRPDIDVLIARPDRVDQFRAAEYFFLLVEKNENLVLLEREMLAISVDENFVSVFVDLEQRGFFIFHGVGIYHARLNSVNIIL